MLDMTFGTDDGSFSAFDLVISKRQSAACGLAGRWKETGAHKRWFMDMTIGMRLIGPAAQLNLDLPRLSANADEVSIRLSTSTIPENRHVCLERCGEPDCVHRKSVLKYDIMEIEVDHGPAHGLYTFGDFASLVLASGLDLWQPVQELGDCGLRCSET